MCVVALMLLFCDSVRAIGDWKNEGQWWQAGKLLNIYKWKMTKFKLSCLSFKTTQMSWWISYSNGLVLSNFLITGQSVGNHYQGAWNPPRHFGWLPSLQDSRICRLSSFGFSFFLVFSFYHPQGFPSRGTTCRNLPTICWLVGRDHLKTQTFPTVPACISSKQWGIWAKPNLHSCCSMLIKVRQVFAKTKLKQIIN